MRDHSVKIKTSFERNSRRAKLGILFVTFCFSQVKSVSAGSFYQRGLPDTRNSNAEFLFSPIQPLPVRELLSNHRVSSLRNGNKVIPGAKLDVLFVDLNDIDKSETRRPIVSSRATNYPSRLNSVQYNRPRQQFRQQSYARNTKQPELNENLFEIERVPVSEIQDILNLLPNIETQIEKLNRQERTRVSTHNSSNNRTNNNNNNYGGYSGNRKRASRQPFTNRMLTKRTNASLMRNNNSVRNTVRTREGTVVYN